MNPYSAAFVAFLSLALQESGFSQVWRYSGSGPWAPPSGYLITPLDQGNVPMDAKVHESPPRIDLRLFLAGTYKIFRKGPSDITWGTEIATVTVSEVPTVWSDSNVNVGEIYEYGIGSTSSTRPNYPSNVLAGINIDRTLPLGRFAVVVAEDVIERLPVEYAQYKADLTTEGWTVHEIVVPRAPDYTGNGTGPADANGIPTGPFPDAHIQIRNQLIALYNQYPGEVKNVVLLGKVPVPRSGIGYTGPDGHGNRAATGADAYYADMDGIWTDTGNNLTSYPAGTDRTAAVKDGRINIAGDNKFDPTFMYQVGGPNARVELGFGRVDFSNSVPAEFEALRNYFAKLHRYKVAAPDFQPGRKACNRNNAPPTGDTVQVALLRNMPGLLGMENLDLVRNAEVNAVPKDDTALSPEDRDAAYTRVNGPYLFYFKGSGIPERSTGSRAVFWTGLQSGWGYWYLPPSSAYNAMQLRLAEENFTLSYTWSIWGADFLYHRLGMGFVAGDMMRTTMNDRAGANILYSTTSTPTALFLNHMGCPSLRLFPFEPPTDLSVVPSGGRPLLSWTASPASGLIGYHIYRSASAGGPFTRLTATPVAGNSYLDSTAVGGAWHYQVRAVRLETTGGGTYYNASLGAQQAIDLTNGPGALMIATGQLPDAHWNTPYDTQLTAAGGTPTYSWALISGTLPPGMSLSPSGRITGQATAGGNYSFEVQATDQLGQIAQKNLSLIAHSNRLVTLFAEEAQYVSGFNTNIGGGSDASMLLSGPVYLYQPFLRFNLASLDTHNSFVRARLILTLDEKSQPNSYAMLKAALTRDSDDNWDETALTYATRPLDDTTVAPVNASAFPVAYETVEFDVTSLVRATLANDPVRKLSLRLFTTLGSSFGNEVRFATRYASGTAPPRLVIETTDAPAIELVSPAASPASVHLGSSLALQANATPIPARAGALSVQWSKVSGPGSAVFSSPAQSSTGVSFTAAGTYVLRLSAHDGVLTSWRDLDVRVMSVPGGTAPATGAVDPSLILRLPLDETAGTAAADVSGVSPANNGTLTTVGTTGNASWVVDGRVGGALQFDGSGQRVEVNDSAATPLDGMQALTVSLWVKMSAADANTHALLVKRTSSSASSTSYAITMTSAEKLSASVANKAGVTGDNILVPGQWYHVVMIYDGSRESNNLQLYLNGSPEKFGTVATGQPNNALPRISASKLRVGDYTATALGGTSLGWNGQIDEVRLYNRTLSLSEIQELAAAKPTNVGPKITLASASVSGETGNSMPLEATVTDDSQPGALSLLWSMASGPGTSSFTAPTSPATNVSFSLAGDYTLRLSASDGEITTFADILATITGGLTPYQQWLQDNGLPTDGSGNGAPGANPSGDGVSNAMKYALGLSANSQGYEGRLVTGTVSVGDANFLSLTFTRPEPPPAGVAYAAQSGENLPLSSSVDIIEVSNTAADGLRTITVRDNQPMNGSASRRFISLQITLP